MKERGSCLVVMEAEEADPGLAAIGEDAAIAIMSQMASLLALGAAVAKRFSVLLLGDLFSTEQED
jgi:Asp/Glu/hydantoin racemase